VSRRGGMVRVSAPARSPLCGGTRGDRGGLSIAALGAATHDGIFFFSQVKVIAAGEVAQLFLVSWRTFTLCPAIGLHPAWCHRARTYLMNCLSVIC